MDDSERMVIRRRRIHLTEVLVESIEDILNDLQLSGVLSEENVSAILLERNTQSSVMRLIDYMILSKQGDTFNAFCNALSNNGYKWLSADLVVDLKVERGEVQPDAQTFEEAAVLVHRKFGTSKRFSETDKKEIAEMIAIKLKITRDEWLKEVERMRESLEEERSKRELKDGLALSVTAQQRDFIMRHQSQLVTHAHDMMTTRDLIQRILNDQHVDDPLQRFKENLEKFLRQMSNVLSQRDALHYEKVKCLKMLGYSNDAKVALDDVISKATGLSVDANLGVVDKDHVILSLKKLVSELEEQNHKQVDGINECRRKLAERDKEISKLRHMVHFK